MEFIMYALLLSLTVIANFFDDTDAKYESLILYVVLVAALEVVSQQAPLGVFTTVVTLTTVVVFIMAENIRDAIEYYTDAEYA